MTKKKTKTVYVNGRKGTSLGPDPRDPDNLTLVDYGGDVHRERNVDIKTTKPRKKK